MKSVLSLIAALIIAPSAFASHGVEKLLPADAQNVTLAKAKIAQYPIGSRHIAGLPNGNIEGVPDTETIFGSKLEVTFKYDSSDSNAEGSGPDGQTYSWDDTRSTAVVVLTVPASTVAAVQNGSVNAKDLVAYTVAKKSVVTTQDGPCTGTDENLGTQNEGYPGDDTCHARSTRVTVSVPVLTVYLK